MKPKDKKFKRPYRVEWEINPRERIRTDKKKTDVKFKSHVIANKDILSEDDLEDLEEFFS